MTIRVSLPIEEAMQVKAREKYATRDTDRDDQNQ